MDLHQLRTFVAVAQEGHLTRAAERLHISQPTASAHIRALEEELGLSLFVRRSHGVETTRAGSLLLQKAEELLDSALEMRSLSRAIASQVEGAIIIGSNADPIVSRVGRLASELRQREPLIDLSIELRATVGILRGVRSGELDCGFFLGRLPEESLECRRLMRVDYRIAAPAAWREAVENADLRGLARMPWILTASGNAQFELLNSLLQGTGLVPTRAMQADNQLVIRSLIAEGVGLSLVRADHAEEGARAGLMCIAPIAVPAVDLFFVFRSARRQEPAIRAILAALESVWSDELLPSGGR